jgi:hypothetical protein
MSSRLVDEEEATEKEQAEAEFTRRVALCYVQSPSDKALGKSMTKKKRKRKTKRASRNHWASPKKVAPYYVQSISDKALG